MEYSIHEVWNEYTDWFLSHGALFLGVYAENGTFVPVCLDIRLPD